MVEKKFCNVCGNELKENKIYLFKRTYLLIMTGFENADLCSKECLLKYIE